MNKKRRKKLFCVKNKWKKIKKIRKIIIIVCTWWNRILLKWKYAYLKLFEMYCEIFRNGILFYYSKFKSREKWRRKKIRKFIWFLYFFFIRGFFGYKWQSVVIREIWVVLIIIVLSGKLSFHLTSLFRELFWAFLHFWNLIWAFFNFFYIFNFFLRFCDFLELGQNFLSFCANFFDF